MIPQTESETLEGAPPPEFSEEDWFVIDEVLHRIARVLRKIEQEEKLKKLPAAVDQ